MAANAHQQSVEPGELTPTQSTHSLTSATAVEVGDPVAKVLNSSCPDLEKLLKLTEVMITNPRLAKHKNQVSALITKIRVEEPPI
jgi:hypothetical protein